MAEEVCKAVIDLINKGREEGIKLGKEEVMNAAKKAGKKEGRTQVLVHTIKCIMKSFDQSFEQACAVLNIDAKDMELYRELVDQGGGVSGPLMNGIFD